ncbi:MAG TPA: hypothetical protein VFM95_02720 [Microcella sp.]|nr:hypothetical protein [Microcella sp.]
MTDADKLERIRSIVADHDAYGLSRHHEMVLDITDVLAEKPEGEEEDSAEEYDRRKAEQRVLYAVAKAYDGRLGRPPNDLAWREVFAAERARREGR